MHRSQGNQYFSQGYISVQMEENYWRRSNFSRNSQTIRRWMSTFFATRQLLAWSGMLIGLFKKKNSTWPTNRCSLRVRFISSFPKIANLQNLVERMSHNASTKVTHSFNSKVLSAAFFMLWCSFKRKRFRDIQKSPYQGRSVKLSHKISSGGARQGHRWAIQGKTPFHFHRVS